jgi:hypothetical protein
LKQLIRNQFRRQAEPHAQSPDPWIGNFGIKVLRSPQEFLMNVITLNGNDVPKYIDQNCPKRIFRLFGRQ